MISKRLHIQLLGGLQIRADYMDEPVEFSLTGRSRRLWTLVAYLVANKDRGVTPQELIEVLWPTSAGANPLSRLQNNVSRARTSLEAFGFKDAHNLIRCTDGLYYWAPDYKSIVDLDILSKHAQTLKSSSMDENDIALAEKSIDLYQGDFLGGAVTEAWAVNIAAYYRDMITSLCQRLLSELIQQNRYQEVQHICIQALSFAPSVEEYSVQLMRAYIAQGSAQKALDHYDYIKKLLNELYEVSPSIEIEAAREEAIQAIHGEEVSEDEVRMFLSVTDGNNGAFYCGNTMFREIVRLHLREVKRYGTKAQLAILSIHEARFNPNIGPERQALQLKRLRATIEHTLRASDPFTKMSSSQLLVLLPGSSRHTASIAIERVLDAFRSDYPFANVELLYTLIDLSSLL